MTVGDESAIEAVLAVPAGLYKRQCWGDLYLTTDALYFVCYADRMAVGSVVTTLGRRAQVRGQLKGTALDEAVKQSQYSRRFAISDVKGFKKAFWTGQAFTAGGTRYQFVHGLGKTQRQQVRAWCETHGVACQGM